MTGLTDEERRKRIRVRTIRKRRAVGMVPRDE